MAHSIIAFPPRSDLYRDALLCARDYSTDALLSFADAFRATVADPDAAYPGEVGRLIAGERLRAVRDELTRRERLSRLERGCATPADRQYAAWRELARVIRDRADVLHVLDLCGYDFVKTGKTEAHAACPLCGGTDRLVITAGPPDLVWCRKCLWGGDVVTVAMSVRRLEFRDAVAWLAEVCGEAVPE